MGWVPAPGRQDLLHHGLLLVLQVLHLIPHLTEYPQDIPWLQDQLGRWDLFLWDIN